MNGSTSVWSAVFHSVPPFVSLLAKVSPTQYRPWKLFCTTFTRRPPVGYGYQHELYLLTYGTLLIVRSHIRESFMPDHRPHFALVHFYANGVCGSVGIDVLFAATHVRLKRPCCGGTVEGQMTGSYPVKQDGTLFLLLRCFHFEKEDGVHPSTMYLRVICHVYITLDGRRPQMYV